MCKTVELKTFRTLEGPARKEAMRFYLAKHHAIDFTADVFTLYSDQRGALVEMAKAVSWRKSISSPLSLGAAFFVYLAKDVKQPLHVAARQASAAKRQAFNYGKGVTA